MKYFLLIMSIMLIFGCKDDSVTSNESKLQLSLEPLQSSVSLGDEIQLEILIDECSIPIFGICLQLEFDNEILSFPYETSIIAGDFFGDNYVAFAQESDGIIHITYTLIQNEDSISGSGSLCSLVLDTINTGFSTINILINKITIYDQDGSLIEVDNIEINNTEVNIF